MGEEQEQHAKLLKALSCAGDIPYVWNSKTDNIEWLGNFDAFIDQGADHKLKTPVNNKDINTMLDAHDMAERQESLENCLRFPDQKQSNIDCEYVMRFPNGKKLLIHDTAQAQKDEETGTVFVYGVLRKLPEGHESRKEILKRLNQDKLTGYLNRSAFCDLIQDDMKSKADNSGAVLLVGIDQFNIYNEAFGAEDADNIIVAVGARLEKMSSNFENASIARVGGDSFAVYVPEITPHETSVFARNILSSLGATQLMTPNGAVRANVSIGSARTPENNVAGQDIVNRAETAMQIAKAQGRGCYEPYLVSEDDQEQCRKWLRTGDDLFVAMNGDRLILAYQPIVDAGTGKPALYECLVRMVRPKKDGSGNELVAAGEFIPAVERLGLSRILDKATLKMALKELKENKDLSFSVNISAYTISDKDWMRALVALVKNEPKVADRLIIEVTETVAMSDMKKAREFVGTLQSMGVRVALDDFGAGFTSFSQIKTLGVDFVKIDKSFVKNLGTCKKDQTFVRSLRDLADSCNITTIGEGAETMAEAEMLHRDGIKLIQGHAYGFPLIDPPWKRNAPTWTPNPHRLN
ncbi:MAG: EAL domain-containing protein [Pseudomonadota bacterium]